jgi:hypothetical protein
MNLRAGKLRHVTQMYEHRGDDDATMMDEYTMGQLTPYRVIT